MERSIAFAEVGDELLGPLKDLPGVWKNKPGLQGRGWNMIALPFSDPSSTIDYRVLMNQYNEELKFSLVDKKVPNRGVVRQNRENRNQSIVTLDYEQFIEQITAEDMPDSGLAGNDGIAIHHEPGLWLNMVNFLTNEQDIARLGTIPHGQSVLALGKSDVFSGPPSIPAINALPIGATQDINSGYLFPYKHFHEKPFKGLFDILNPHRLLQQATPPNVIKTTKLEVSTENESAGLVNIPFTAKHANATEMQSTFWIMELDEQDENGVPIHIMQYLQVVMIEFFDRFDEEPGLIKWPHISFNTLRRFPFDAAEMALTR